MKFFPCVKSKRWPDLLQAVVVLVVGAILMQRVLYLLGTFSTFRTDDAYITLRYSKHLALGHGIVWNIGEAPIEGYSNFLFVLLGAGAIRFDLDPFLTLRVASLAGFLLACIASYLIARTWLPPLGALLPSLLITGLEGEFLWAASGLETVAFQGIGLCFLLCCIKARERKSAALFCLAGLLAVLAALCRPEGGIFMVVFGTFYLIRAVQRYRAGLPFEGRSLTTLAVFSVLMLAYLSWKLAYFGSFLPHSVVCKMEFSGDQMVLLRSAWGEGKVLVVLSLVMPLRLWKSELGLMMVIVASYCFMLYGADPIIGYANRHFLMSFAILTVTASVSLFHAAGLHHLPSLRQAILQGLVLCSALFVQVSLEDFPSRWMDWVERYERRTTARLEVANWINANLPNDSTYTIGDAGLIPFHTPHEVQDLFCLNNDLYTSPEIGRNPEKFVSALFQTKPDAIIVHSSSPSSLVPRPEYGIFPRIVSHPDFLKYYQSRVRIGAPGDDFHYWVFTRQKNQEQSF